MAQLLTRRWSPTRGGHAPGSIRDQFLELIEDDPVPVDSAAARRLTGLLWNCTDILPSSDCDMLDLAAGSSYAQAARKLRANLR